MSTATTDPLRAPTPEPVPPAHERWWRAGAGLATVVTAALYVVIAQSAVAPRTPYDENGVLQMARLIAGQDVSPSLSSGYYPGWSFLMAPLWWLSNNPEVIYRGAIVLNIVIALATIWPLAKLCRHLGTTGAQGVVIAAIVMALPARSVHADYVLSEPLLMFTVAWMAVAVFAWSRRPTSVGVLLVVLAGTAAYLVHARAVAVMLTLAVWLLLLLLSRPRQALTGFVGLAVGYLVVQAAVAAITEPSLVGDFGKEELMSTAISTTTPALLAKVSLTQMFAQLTATFGMFAVGSVVLVIRALPELRSRRAGPWVLLLGLTVSTCLVSFLWWSGPRFLESDSPRFDVWVYTRYIDPVAAIVVTIALAAIVTGLRRSTIVTAMLGTAVVCVPVVLLVSPNVPTWGSRRGPGNAAGVLHWSRFWGTNEPFNAPLVPSLTNANNFWLLASLVLAASLVALLFLRTRSTVVLAAAFATAVLAGIAANPSQFRDPPRAMLSGVETYENLSGTAQATVEFDLSCQPPGAARNLTLNWIVFWFSPREVESLDRPTGDLVIACDAWPQASDLGARAIKDATNYGFRVWVLPGPVQNELAADNRLGMTPSSGALGQ